MSAEDNSHEHRQPGAPLGGSSDQELDALLIGRIQCRDEGALSALYDLWADRVYSVALGVLGDAEEAEEVVEWTLSRIWRDSLRYDPTRGSVGAWIVVIARSRALTQLRAQARRDRRHDAFRTAQLEMEGQCMAASPLHIVEQDEHRDRITQAVSRLPAEQQRVVRMTFFEGLSQTEIAARLGVPLGTVKTRVRLAFSKLRGFLADLRERDR